MKLLICLAFFQKLEIKLSFVAHVFSVDWPMTTSWTRESGRLGRYVLMHYHARRTITGTGNLYICQSKQD